MVAPEDNDRLAMLVASLAPCVSAPWWEEVGSSLDALSECAPNRQIPASNPSLYAHPFPLFPTGPLPGLYAAGTLPREVAAPGPRPPALWRALCPSPPGFRLGDPPRGAWVVLGGHLLSFREPGSYGAHPRHVELTGLYWLPVGTVMQRAFFVSCPEGGAGLESISGQVCLRGALSRTRREHGTSHGSASGGRCAESC